MIAALLTREKAYTLSQLDKVAHEKAIEYCRDRPFPYFEDYANSFKAFVALFPGLNIANWEYIQNPWFERTWNNASGQLAGRELSEFLSKLLKQFGPKEFPLTGQCSDDFFLSPFRKSIARTAGQDLDGWVYGVILEGLSDMRDQYGHYFRDEAVVEEIEDYDIRFNRHGEVVDLLHT